MSKKGIILVCFAALLGGIYLLFFTGLFRKHTVEIVPQIRPLRGRQAQSYVYPVSFLLRGTWQLTSVKVVSEADQATNKYPIPLWHLISDSKSEPIQAFMYGGKIAGMKPAVEDTRPEPLQPNVPYVILVEAGPVKGQTNFQTLEIVQPAVR